MKVLNRATAAVASVNYVLYGISLVYIINILNNYDFARSPFLSYAYNTVTMILFITVFTTILTALLSLVQLKGLYRLSLVFIIAIFSDVARVLDVIPIMVIGYIICLIIDIRKVAKNK